MIRALRRWLLGVEPDGPPLLADPLYRYEARNYWTPARSIAAAAVLLVWVGLVAYWLAAVAMDGGGPDFPVMFTLWLALLGRAPLTYMASTGAALCIAPERASGQFEQFLLTPVDSWRFCLARLAGRLRGLLVIGLVIMPVLLGAVLLLALEHRETQYQSWDATRDWDLADLLLPAVVVAFSLIDLPAMLLVDAAVGMRFTSTSTNTAAALVKTYLVNFLLTPASMYLGAMAAFFAAMVLGRAVADSRWDITCVLVLCAGTLATRLALAAVAIRLALRDARGAIHKTFYEPGDGA